MSKLSAELDRLRLMDVTFGMARVPYAGNDTWAAIGGKKLMGYDAALKYAKRLQHAIKYACVRKDRF